MSMSVTLPLCEANPCNSETQSLFQDASVVLKQQLRCLNIYTKSNSTTLNIITGMPRTALPAVVLKLPAIKTAACGHCPNALDGIMSPIRSPQRSHFSHDTSSSISSASSICSR